MNSVHNLPYPCEPSLVSFSVASLPPPTDAKITEIFRNMFAAQPRSPDDCAKPVIVANWHIEDLLMERSGTKGWKTRKFYVCDEPYRETGQTRLFACFRVSKKEGCKEYVHLVPKDLLLQTSMYSQEAHMALHKKAARIGVAPQIFSAKANPSSPSSSLVEFANGGDLMDFLSKHPLLTRGVRGHIAWMVSRDIWYLHLNKIYHRDVKPENFLVQARGKNITVQVADFGYATQESRSADKLGSPGFCAPEIRFCKEYVPEQGDWYALGATIFTILTNGSFAATLEKFLQLPQISSEYLPQFFAASRSKEDASLVEDAFQERMMEIYLKKYPREFSQVVSGLLKK